MSLAGDVARNEGTRRGPATIGLVLDEADKVLAGKRSVVEMVLTAFLARGHVLLEDVPGVGKTTLARTLARAMDLQFGRIQFTSDMLPSDVVGTQVFHPHRDTFVFRPGPVFCGLLLADELNRTSPRTQSALLQAMSEGVVTVDTETHDLPTPFLVIATQNPRELYGTYPLPESQLDRFLLSVSMGYPDAAQEKAVIVGHNDQKLDEVSAVVTRNELLHLQEAVTQVHAAEPVVDYVYRILKATRESGRFEIGASPRAGIQMMRAARAFALVRGRQFVTPDDVHAIAPAVLIHRLSLKSSASTGGGRNQTQAALLEMLSAVAVP